MSQNCQNGLYQGQRMLACLDRAIGFFALLFTLALGVILGAVFSTTVLPNLATVIVFAVIMLVAIIALLIYRYCIYRR